MWVLRAQVGDRDALDALLRRIQQPSLRYLESVMQDRALAEDALQEFLLILCRKLKTLRDPALFRPWCFRIASRHAFKTLRRERRWRRDRSELRASNTPLTDDSESLDDILDANQIASSLDRLSPLIRAVIALHYLEEMSIGEVAAALEIPSGTVKSRLAYGLRELRDIWWRER